jgi:hypothetical protein
MCRSSIPGWSTSFVWEGEVCVCHSTSGCPARPCALPDLIHSSYYWPAVKGHSQLAVVHRWFVSFVWPKGHACWCRTWQVVRGCCWRGVIANCHLRKGERYCPSLFTTLILNLICIWPCIINVGKVNMELQLDATITVLLISKISSTCFGQTVSLSSVRRQWHRRTRCAKQHARLPCLPHNRTLYHML